MTGSGINLTPKVLAPDQGIMEAFGWKGMTWSPLATNSTQSMVSGTTRYSQVYLRAGDTVSTIWFHVSTASSGLTLLKVGVYTAASSSDQLAVSANSAALADTAGYRSLALTAPYVATATGVYLFAILAVGTTPPVIGSQASVGGKYPSSGNLVQVGATEASQTDLDATATLTGSGVAHWFAWS